MFHDIIDINEGIDVSGDVSGDVSPFVWILHHVRYILDSNLDKN